MKIKVFTKNNVGKIEFTEEELKNLLDEVYWEGYNNHTTWTWQAPSWSPYVWTSTTKDITLSSNVIASGSITGTGGRSDG